MCRRRVVKPRDGAGKFPQSDVFNVWEPVTKNQIDELCASALVEVKSYPSDYSAAS